MEQAIYSGTDAGYAEAEIMLSNKILFASIDGKITGRIPVRRAQSLIIKYLHFAFVRRITDFLLEIFVADHPFPLAVCGGYRPIYDCFIPSAIGIRRHFKVDRRYTAIRFPGHRYRITNIKGFSTLGRNCQCH
jgi:hypothetical protein